MIIPLFNYSTFLHTRRMKVKKSLGTFFKIIIFWLIICYLPMAIEFQSKLIAYITFALMFYFLAFSTHFLGLFTEFGIKPDRIVERIFITSLFFITLYILLITKTSIDKFYLKPFLPAVLKVGAHMLYFTGLIQSWEHFYKQDKLQNSI